LAVEGCGKRKGGGGEGSRARFAAGGSLAVSLTGVVKGGGEGSRFAAGGSLAVSSTGDEGGGGGISRGCCAE